MANVTEGDRVRIVTRDATEDDAKSNMYFGFFGGLTGLVSKVYNPGEVSVEIEPESLTKDIRRRHDDVRDQMKTKWLDGLSEEGRSKLTEREKDFNLRFMILVKMDDLEQAGPKPPPPVRANAAAAAIPAATSTEVDTPRKTLAELEAAEAEELLRRQQS